MSVQLLKQENFYQERTNESIAKSERAWAQLSQFEKTLVKSGFRLFKGKEKWECWKEKLPIYISYCKPCTRAFVCHLQGYTKMWHVTCCRCGKTYTFRPFFRYLVTRILEIFSTPSTKPEILK